MASWLIFTRASAPKFAKLINWLFDLPRKGTHHGGGIHADQPATLPNPPPLDAPGWTTRQWRWVAKPSNTGAPTDEFAVQLRPALQAAWQAKKDMLTPAQKTWVQNHIDVASNIELRAAWKRTVQDPQYGETTQVVESDDVEPEA